MSLNHVGTDGFISSVSYVSSGCLTGSWSVWSHAVTPHSTIYHLVFVSRLLLKFGVQGQSKIGDRSRSSCFLKTKGGHAVMFLMYIWQ